MQYSISEIEIQKLIENGKTLLNQKQLILVVNSINKTPKRINNHSDTDFFSDNEINEFQRSLQSMNINFKIIHSEKEFVKRTLNNEFTSQNSIIWNLTRQGSYGNVKSLVTSVADFMQISYIGSSIETMNICRDKYKFENLIQKNNLSGIEVYSNNKLANFENNRTLIIKDKNGAASVGINQDSIGNYSKDELNQFLKKNSNLMAEEFIPGYEVEVPVLKTKNGFKALMPIGIEINDNKLLLNGIITEKISEKYDYKFYDIKKTFNFIPELDSSLSIANIIHNAVSIASILDLSNYGRIDFRIDPDGNPFCFDIATTPYFINHSSLIFAFKKWNLSQSELIFAILGTEN